jgi:hypothetical protein
MQRQPSHFGSNSQSSPSKGSRRWVNSIGEIGKGRLTAGTYARQPGVPTAAVMFVALGPRSDGNVFASVLRGSPEHKGHIPRKRKLQAFCGIVGARRVDACHRFATRLRQGTR